jgi:hypothetical protein
MYSAPQNSSKNYHLTAKNALLLNAYAEFPANKEADIVLLPAKYACRCQSILRV